MVCFFNVPQVTIIQFVKMIQIVKVNFRPRIISPNQE